KENAFVALHGADNAKSKSKITSLQAGVISNVSTDAVNGSQLYLLGNGLARSLGGGAQYENGEWKAPKFKVHVVKEDGS
ncbi:hypothetical protein, partial [Bartonella phoceensis]|uniref:hypothetical protein n=1 Tax=Bartonella phoceensis TaxID=270249 RepID=UPI001ABB6FFB